MNINAADDNYLNELQIELQKRVFIPYHWRKKQNNHDDAATNFIYQTFHFEEVMSKICQITNNQRNELFDYALNRWYNFWSAKACEMAFCRCEGVHAALNEKDRLVDFTINGISFDHKTTVFPKQFNHTPQYARQHPDELIDWLYQNQSQGNRKHLYNRLFVVLYRHDGDHWKLKSNLKLLQQKIQDYVTNFDAHCLKQFSYNQNFTTLSDLIWVEE